MREFYPYKKMILILNYTSMTFIIEETIYNHLDQDIIFSPRIVIQAINDFGDENLCNTTSTLQSNYFITQNETSRINPLSLR